MYAFPTCTFPSCTSRFRSPSGLWARIRKIKWDQPWPRSQATSALSQQQVWGANTHGRGQIPALLLRQWQEIQVLLLRTARVLERHVREGIDKAGCGAFRRTMLHQPDVAGTRTRAG